MNPPSLPKPRRAAFVSAAALITLAVFAFAVYVRRISEFAPPSLSSLTHFKFDPYTIGFTVQELIIPVTLIYLFSSTNLFRRIVGGEAAAGDRPKLFGVLAIFQLLFLGYDLGLFFLIDDHATFGFLVLVTGGLIGGWRVGLGLGLITMLARGTFNYALSEGAYLLSVYRMEGVPALIYWPWDEVFFWHYLADLWALSPAWAGVMAGFIGDLLAERRFVPGFALGLGVGIDLVAGYLMAIPLEEPGPLIALLIPSVLVSGLAMAAIALIVRNVQAEVTRRRAEVTELALAQAELRALRAQINPHFLFNALNTIRYCVRTNPEAARRLLLNLSEVFQSALRTGGFVPLKAEIGYVEAYLSLEKARLGGRLQVAWSLPPGESPLLEHPIPTLILQPIVENAVIHGVSRKPEGGTVGIAVTAEAGELLLRVEDDGPGMDSARLGEMLAPVEEGQPPLGTAQGDGSGKAIGLRNVDGRLRALYGDDHRLVIESRPGRGACVKIRIPVVE